VTDDVPLDAPLLELEVGPIAHGGHCVARHEGRVVFVRHTLPGERVLARLTQAGDDASLWRAEAVEVLEASPDRVPSAWPAAGPGGVGGGELAHVALPAQRRWKETVIAEQLRRLAHDDRAVTVEPAPEDDARGGLAWRTRIELVVDDEGRAGMRGHRSHEVRALESMPLAVEAIGALGLFGRTWPAGSQIEAIAPIGGDAPFGGDAPVVLVDGQAWDLVNHRPDTSSQARTTVHETVQLAGRSYEFRVAADGFWQVHRKAPAVLVDAVLAGLGGWDATGATVLDLYSGAGLFSAPLADAVGPTGQVVAVEGDERAVRDARRNAHLRHNITLVHGEVSRVLADPEAADAIVHADAVVLDPPRTGAGKKIVAQIGELRPDRIVYVACDPAALARDVAYLAESGYGLAELRAFDLFPMTHHVECVAVLTRG
jgi:tRNA/tmRNA/rRNA uracil-C5-methylase (TrmA/RlmC/RlmD family)